MNLEQYARLREIVLKALVLSGPERNVFLDDACGSDAALRKDVQALLDGHGHTADVVRTGGLDEALASAVHALPPAEQPGRLVGTDPATAAARLPDTIGAYRILDLLGEGGMGIVYRALQTTPVSREVAIKLVRSGFDSAGAVARFESERQTLAMMDHPNIARLYEAGTSVDCRPYFVMELVRGVPITDFCKTGRLALRQRVELFLDVCRGVRHAHRRGVIHRDLKPSNILVAREESQTVPKVIDFSIAKALGGLDAGSGFRTRTGQIIGTLDYMSPEQAAGRIDAVDMRSDVYALGVVLYELLADRLPHDVAGQPLHEAVRRIVESPVPPLAATFSRMGSRYGDDLETIVSKCLEKDPERRYGSAADLVEDLERYLDSRPILARPPNTLYQLRKLVTRHRALVGSGALALILLVVFSIVVTIQLGVQRRERLRAQSEADKAQRINEFLQEMLSAADPMKQGGKASIREVLDLAAHRAEDSLGEHPEVAAELQRTLGRTYEALGLVTESKEHLEQSLALRIRNLGEEHPDTARARLDLAEHLLHASHYDAAEHEARRALAIYRALYTSDHADIADSLDLLGSISYDAGRLEDARRMGEEALAMWRRLLGAADPRVGHCLNRLGVVLTDLGSTRDGESLLRESTEVFKTAHGERGPAYLDSVADLAYNLAIQQRFEEATRLNESVLGARIDLLGENHPSVATSQNNLAVNLMSLGRCGEAEEHAMDGLRILRRVYGEQHRDVAISWNNIGFMRACAGDYEGSRAAYETAWQIARNRPEELSSIIPRLCLNFADIYGRLGRLQEGEAFARRALSASGECAGTQLADRWAIYWELGSVLLEAGRPAEAEIALIEARRLQEAAAAESSKRLDHQASYVVVVNALGRSIAAQNRQHEADELLARTRREMLESIESADAKRHELTRTAELYERLGRSAEASAYRNALKHLNDLTDSKQNSALPPERS